MKPTLRFKPLHDLLDILFPRHCCGCGSILTGEEHGICSNCLIHLPLTRYTQFDDNHTEQVLCEVERLVAATSLLYFRFGSISRNIVHSIKYCGNRQMAYYMGRMLGLELLRSGRFDCIDYLIPVPLHRKKERKRGYNQSALLCLGISDVMHIEVIKNNLIRTVNTESQTNKKRAERIENMRGVFTVKEPLQLQGKHVLLVDDVLTTGATVSACCKAMEKIDNIKISVATLAIAST